MTDLWLPSDPAAERAALGAVLIVLEADAVQAFKIVPDGKMFLDTFYGWLWDRLRWQRKTGRWEQRIQQLWADGCCGTAARIHGSHLAADLARLIVRANAVDLLDHAAIVRRLHEQRIAIMDAADKLKRVIERARR